MGWGPRNGLNILFIFWNPNCVNQLEVLQAFNSVSLCQCLEILSDSSEWLTAHYGCRYCSKTEHILTVNYASKQLFLAKLFFTDVGIIKRKRWQSQNKCKPFPKHSPTQINASETYCWLQSFSRFIPKCGFMMEKTNEEISTNNTKRWPWCFIIITRSTMRVQTLSKALQSLCNSIS